MTKILHGSITYTTPKISDHYGDYCLRLDRFQSFHSKIFAIGVNQAIVSTDLGNTWSNLNIPFASVEAVECLVAYSDELLAFVSSSLGSHVLFKSTNSDRWSERSSLPSADLVAAGELSDVLLFASTCEQDSIRVYTSNDRARSWKLALELGDIRSAIIDFNSDQIGICISPSDFADGPSTFRALDLSSGSVLETRTVEGTITSLKRVGYAEWLLGSNIGRLYRYQPALGSIVIEHEFESKEANISSILGSAENLQCLVESGAFPPAEIEYYHFDRVGRWNAQPLNLRKYVYDAMFCGDYLLINTSTEIWKFAR